MKNAEVLVLESLIKRGTQRGFLIMTEVQQELEDAEAKPEAFDEVFVALRDQEITIREDSNDALAATALSKDELVHVSDPVRMYLPGDRPLSPLDRTARGGVGDANGGGDPEPTRSSRRPASCLSVSGSSSSVPVAVPIGPANGWSRPICGSWSRSQRSTSVAGSHCSISFRRATLA